jgi:hypothetical protein
MIKKILLILVAAILLLVIVASLRPSQFTVTRWATIPATPEVVFAQVNDFHKWQEWSPWAKMDPACKFAFSGPDSGVGAGFSWDGNNDVGAGTMKITESKPGELVKIDLYFTKPMEGHNLTVFTFKPNGASTDVTWTMSGENGFMGKLFGLFVDCDKMVGEQFIQGLRNLSGVVTKAPTTN